jgi:hypothetical protein
MLRRLSNLPPVEIIPFALVALSAVLVAILGYAKGFTFLWWSAMTPALVIVLMSVVAWVYSTKRPDERLAASAMATINLLLVTNVMMPLSYLAMAAGGPLWDDRFMAWDRALGFDWFAYADFVNAHPVLVDVLRFAYQSMLPQAAVAALLLPAIGQSERLKVFIAAFATAAILTISISALMPAMSIWPTQGAGLERYPNLDPAAGFIHVPHVTGLRDGTFKTLMIVGGEGILTFPSFHTAFGVLLIHVFWTTPWFIRWPAIVLNVLMIAATPIDGGHYIVDLLAGGAVAVFAIILANMAARVRSDRRVATTASTPVPLPLR